MFKIGKYILLSVWLMLSIFVASAQTFDYEARSATPPSGAYLGDVSSGDKVCPSLDFGSGRSTSVFRVKNIANATDLGDPTLIRYTWVVYGGWITKMNGVDFSPSVDNVQTYTDDANSHRYSYVTIALANPLEDDPTQWESFIEVEWDDENDETIDGWVAVLQTSEWGCSDQEWSLFRNQIKNDAPVFTTVFDNISLPFTVTQDPGYTLPMPSATDDGCNSALVYTYEIALPDNTTFTIGADNSLPENRVIEYLQVGENTVTWTVTDGSHETTGSYVITVDPKIEIEHVAWINPYWDNSCNGLNTGSLMVTQTNLLQLNSLVVLTYGLDCVDDNDYDVAPQALPSFAGLPPGTYRIWTRATYPSGSYYDSDFYEVLLTGFSNTVVDAVPEASSSDVVIVDAGCFSDADGRISVTTSNMTSLNESVYFDGVNDYMLLNKSYETNSLSQLSVAAWIKLDAAPQRGTIISFDGDDYFQLEITSTSRVRLSSSALPGVVFVNNMPLNDGNWHLVVASFNNGQYSLFVDGNIEGPATALSNTVGTNQIRWGMIGAKADNVSVFGGSPQPDYFKGNIAEIAIWDNYSITTADVKEILRNGISKFSTQPSDQWIFNGVPSVVSAASPTVFSDLGNLSTSNHWARFVNGPAIALNNAPILFDWTNSDGDNIEADYTVSNKTTIKELMVGDYSLTVKDFLGCKNQTSVNPYQVGNSDTQGPELHWNVALGASAVDNNSADDSFLTDGKSDTSIPVGSTSIRIDLGGQYNIREVALHTGVANFGEYYVTLSNNPLGAPEVAREQVEGNDPIEITHFLDAAQYVFITPVAGTLGAISEIEVYASDVPKPRIFYLSDLLSSCTYKVLPVDLTIKPYAYDACDGIETLVHDAAPLHPELSGNTNSIEGILLALGDNTIKWTATDDIGKTDELTVNYRVVDNVPPVFVAATPKISEMATRISYCTLNEKKLSLPIPRVRDNYMGCNGTTLKSIILTMNGLKEYEVPMGTYNPDVQAYYDVTLSATEGFDYRFEWTILDHSNNPLTDVLNMRLEVNPIIRKVNISANRCNLGENIIVFTDIQVEPAQVVNYFLVRDGDGFTYPTSGVNTDGVFENVAKGTYKAYIEVNGCRSAPYFEDVVVGDPVSFVFSNRVIVPVDCVGAATGSIDLGNEVYLGGSQTTTLHFMGGTGVASSVSNYAGLDLTTQGTIEGWLYLDDLSATVNQNVGLFGVRSGASDGYGIRMNAGQLQFYVGVSNVSLVVQPRIWYHVSGRWTPTSMVLTATSSAHNPAPATGGANTGNPLASGAGSLYIASDGEASSAILEGFVRSVRVWNVALPDLDLARNKYLDAPIVNVPNSFVAGLPMQDGSATLQNQVSGSVDGAVVSSNIAWQKFAYYWTDSDGNFVARTKDIANQEGGDYTIRLDDPIGCSGTETIFIKFNDFTPPRMFFSNAGYNTAPFFEDGGNIWRYTTAGICSYTPNAKEFDPFVDDGVCPASDVTLKMEILRNGDLPDGTPVAGLQTLNGIQMSDSITIRWTATDRAKLSTSQTITYYIVDNQQPAIALTGPAFTGMTITHPTAGENLITIDAGATCNYTIAGNKLVPAVTDNCFDLDNLYNTYNSDNNLNGVVLTPGDYTYKWIYNDKSFSEVPEASQGGKSATIEYDIKIVDNTPPTLVLNQPSSFSPINLNASGQVEVKYDQVMNLNPGQTDDNCGIDQYIIATNVAYKKKATARDVLNGLLYENEAGGAAGLANDGGYSNIYDNATLFHSSNCNNYEGGSCARCPYPWWEVDLGEDYRIFKIVVYLRNGFAARTNNFYTLVSNYPNAYDPLSSTVAFGPQPYDDPGTTADNADWTLWRSGNYPFPSYVVYSSFVLGNSQNLHGDYSYIYDENGDGNENIPVEGVVGRHVRIWNGAGNLIGDQDRENSACLQIAEVEVYGAPVGNTESFTLTCNDVRPPLPSPNPKDYRDYTNLLTRVIDGEGLYADAPLVPIKVVDDTPPEMGTNAITVYLNESGTVDLNDYVDQINNGTSDACGIDEFWVVPNSINGCGLTKAQTVKFYARDVNGNENWQETQVTILDQTPPDVVVKEYVQLELNELGYYEIDAKNDLVESAIDNCASTNLLYQVSPSRVECVDKGKYVDLTLTVTDRSGNPTVKTVKAYVIDLLPPTAITDNFTLVMESDGITPVKFSDIVSATNLYDNCEGTITAGIKYEENYMNWCPAGQEGLETTATDMYTNIAGLATVAASSGQYAASYSPDYVKDQSLGTAYISSANTGTVTLTYDFGNKYEISSSGVVWHERDFIVESAVSHNAAYLQAGDISLYDSGNYLNTSFPLSRLIDGNTTTYFKTNKYIDNGQIWIQYSFDVEMIFTRTKLMWFTDGNDAGDITLPNAPTIWYSTNNTNWIKLGDIGTSATNYNELNCGNIPARYIRVSFSQQDYSYTALREWYVYGYPVSLKNCVIPTGTTLAYSPDGVSAFTNLGAVTGNTTPDQNTLTFSPVEAQRLRLTIPTGGNRHVGIKEWYVNGREACRPVGSNQDLARATGTTYANTNFTNVGNAYNGTTNSPFATATATSGAIEYTFNDKYLLNQSVAYWTTVAPTIEMQSTASVTRTNASNTNLTRCNNNDKVSNYYSTGAGNTNEITIVYTFPSPIVMTGSSILWNGTTRVPSSITIDYNNGSWQNLQTIANSGTTTTFAFAQVTTSVVRIRFNQRGNTTDARIYEWIVNGYAPYVLPTTTALKYDDNGTWVTAGTISPTGTWTLPLNVTTNKVRLEYAKPAAGTVALAEWQVFGGTAPKDNCIPCTNFTCDDVNTDVPVWLQWTDESGNTASTKVTVPVEPYFNVNNILLKECGVQGQRYYPVIENFTPTTSTLYQWSEVTDNGQALFQYPGNTIDYRPDPPYNDNVAANVATPVNIADAWLPYTRTYSTDYAYQRVTPGDYLPAGNYEVKVRVTDDNGCWDEQNANFTASGSGKPLTEKKIDVCYGSDETLSVQFPTDRPTFWRQSGRNITWTPGAGFVSPATSGGGSGDFSLTETFDYTNGGTPVIIDYAFDGAQLEYASAPIIEVSDGVTPVNCSDCQLIVSTMGTNAYVVSDVDYNGSQTFAYGQQYINGNVGANYVASCSENLRYLVSVIDVPQPVLYARDGATWIPVDEDFEICMMDEVEFRVENNISGNADYFDYDYFGWDILNESGTLLANGKSTDNTIKIRFDNPVLASAPNIVITGYKKKTDKPLLSCSNSTTMLKPYNDSERPVLTYTGGNITKNNTAGLCHYTFDETELPIPAMSDNCSIETWSNSFNNKKNAAGVYPVGTTTVTWTATDYSGNVSLPVSYDVIVTDSEAPTFKKIPANRTLETNDGCSHKLADTSLDVTAEDNCPSNTAVVWASVYELNGVVLGDLLDDNLPTLQDYEFPLGTLRVIWHTHDGIDYASDGTFDNIRTISVDITVIDRTAPTLDVVNHVVNDLDNCSEAVAIADPVPHDNCSSDAYMVDKFAFAGRSDGRPRNGLFDVGITEIYWTATDEYGNQGTVTQTVEVKDEVKPWVSATDPAIQDVQIGYCNRDKFRLKIPAYLDNCQVYSFTWRIYKTSDNSEHHAAHPHHTVTRDINTKLDPYANGYIMDIDPFIATPEAGGDYYVTWSFVDANGNVSDLYRYDIRIQVEPRLGSVTPYEMTCGNALNGKIVVNLADALYRAEPASIPQYALNDNWTDAQVSSTFEGLGEGTYSVKMRINGCYSNSVGATIKPSESYTITLSKTEPECYEGTDGTVSLTMTDGVDAQLEMNNTPITATYYSGLDVGSSGSIEAWVYLDALGNSTILSKGTSYSLGVNASDQFVLNVGGTTATASVNLNVKQWYYVVGAWDATGTRLFVDETLSGSAGAPVVVGNGLGNVTLGTNFRGIIREVRIWNTPLNGVHHSGKLAGSEPGLVAYWPLYTQQASEANQVSGGTPLTRGGGLTALWNSSLPQPGRYNWYKYNDLAGQYDPYATDDLVDLTGLGVGTYKVVFFDPYLCPTEGLSAVAILDATDAEKPVISNIATQTVHVTTADANCQYVIKATDSHLWPTIADNCDYTVTWRVVPYLTAVAQHFNGTNSSDNKIIGAKLELGQNTVTVTTTQNKGRVVSTREYIINVIDKVNPTAVTNPIAAAVLNNSNNPMGSGFIEYDAFDLNDNSSDNCTPKEQLTYGISDVVGVPTPPYPTSVTFDCDDVGTPKQVSFIVIDASGNPSVVQGTPITVLDDNVPEFTRSTVIVQRLCAELSDANGDYVIIPASLGLKLGASEYTDNCTVRGITHRFDYYGYGNSVIYDFRTTDWSSDNFSVNFNGNDLYWDDDLTGVKLYEGVTEVWFRLYDGWNDDDDDIDYGTNARVVYRIEILPRPELVNPIE